MIKTIYDKDYMNNKLTINLLFLKYSLNKLKNYNSDGNEQRYRIRD